ncbi:Kinesin-like protein KIF11 [Bienertia sinuspersici]
MGVVQAGGQGRGWCPGGLAGVGVGGWVGWGRGAVQGGFRGWWLGGLAGRAGVSGWWARVGGLYKGVLGDGGLYKGVLYKGGMTVKMCTTPQWYSVEALRAHMKKIRQEDEDFQRRLSQCSKNRMWNECQRVHHRQGSISAEVVKNNMGKELDRLRTAPELYYDGHVDNDGQFVNPKAKQVWDEFQKKKAGNLECEDETQKKSEDELFFEVVAGWNEKGRIFGLGAAAHSYYDRPTYEEKNGKKSWREYIKSLETQVVELVAKNDDQNKELDQTKQELDQTKQELGETKQGLVETQTKLVRTQHVLIETKKTLAETTESFMTFKKEVEKLCKLTHLVRDTNITYDFCIS